MRIFNHIQFLKTGKHMKRILIILGLVTLLTSNVFAISTIVETSSAGTTVKFTAKLSERLPTGYKVKIDYSNGKGFVPMTCNVLTCTLSTNVLPQGFPYVPYRVGVYNSSGVLQGQLSQGTYGIFGVVINAQTPVATTPTTPPSASTDYSKISNSGNILPDTAVLGSSPNDWACTKDNKTGLVWEVKTSDAGLHSMNNTYTNYYYTESGYGTNTNSDAFVSLVNNNSYCGASNWRMPSSEELKGIVYCSDGKYNSISGVGNNCTNFGSVDKPAINSKYFPNTKADIFWSKSIPKDSSFLIPNSANFGPGNNSLTAHDAAVNVRLVHDYQSPLPAYTKVSNSGAVLPDTAVLGSGANDWACTKDNKTGLTWEVKTTDGGLRDMRNFYNVDGSTSWSTPNVSVWLSASSIDSFISAVNKQSLCGSSDWRLPKNDELLSLIICSDGKYSSTSQPSVCVNYNSVTRPMYNASYFPNTDDVAGQVGFYTLEMGTGDYGNNLKYKSCVNFYFSTTCYVDQRYFQLVRLVRG
jgi:hypothetical protein